MNIDFNDITGIIKSKTVKEINVVNKQNFSRYNKNDKYGNR